MEKIYDLIRRSSALISGLSDNAAFVLLLTSYPGISAKTLIILHLVAMIAKSIYYKDTKVIKESQVDVVGMPRTKSPVQKIPLFNLGIGRSFIYGDNLYMKTNRQSETHIIITNVFDGSLYQLPKDTWVEPKLATVTVK